MNTNPKCDNCENRNCCPKKGNITKHCKGCEKIDENSNCTVYSNPTEQMRWMSQPNPRDTMMPGCHFNYFNLTEPKKPTKKVRVGQQKQKKRR